MNKEKATVRAILDYIEQHDLQAGALLPSASVHVQDLGVSANTVRRALHRLTEFGVIHAHQGKGTFLKQVVSPELRTRIEQSFRPSKKNGARLHNRVALERVYRIKLVHHYSLEDDVFKKVTNGIAEVVDSFGYSLSLQQSEGMLKKTGLGAEEVESFFSDVDGVIFWTDNWGEDKSQLLSEIKKPYSLICSTVSHNNGVSLDAEEACRKAVSVMAHKGHQYIAVLDPYYEGKSPKLTGIYERLKRELKNVNIRFFHGPDYLEKFFAHKDFQKTTALYFGDDVFCCRDLVKLAAKGLLPSQGVEVFTWANLDTSVMIPNEFGKIIFDLEELGRQAVFMLQRALKYGDGRPLPSIKVGGIYAPA